MNIKQAHREFELFLDKVDSQATPDLLPQEKDVFIHEAELRLINQSYGRNNIYQMGFQEMQKRTDDLNSLVKNGYIVAEDTDETDTFKFDLTKIYKDKLLSGEPVGDYLYYLGAKLLVHSTRTDARYVDAELVSLDDLPKALDDPHKGTKIYAPIIYFSDGCIYVVTKGFNVAMMKLSYIKYPRKVDYKLDISSELPEHKQREAIQLAVRIALGNIESPRFQEQDQQLKSLE